MSDYDSYDDYSDGYDDYDGYSEGSFGCGAGDSYYDLSAAGDAEESYYENVGNNDDESYSQTYTQDSDYGPQHFGEVRDESCCYEEAEEEYFRSGAAYSSNSSDEGEADSIDDNVVTNYQIYKEYGGFKNFMDCHGLKIYNHEDIEEAKSILEGIKQVRVDGKY